MRAPLTDAELDGRLHALGLERDESVVAPPPSKNRTLVCKAGRKRVLVKVADGPGNVGVLREGSVLERVAPLAQGSEATLLLPEVYAFDPAHGLLALHWLNGGETLHHFHRRSGDYPRPLARQVGKALGYLHRMSRSSPSRFALADAFRDESDLLDCFLRMRPDFYARLSKVGLELFGRVQADQAATSGLQALWEQQQRETESCLLHGDLREANLLRVGRDAKAPVYFLDWELSFWGDPARDLGSLLSDYVGPFLAPEHPSEVLSQQQLAGFGRALLGSYAAQRESGFQVDDAFQERVVRWVGTSLLIAVYGISHYEQVLDDRARLLAAKALEMLASPARWPAIFWGDPE
ncbi:MAG: phosphotransferase [Myxococcaceae bacterium]|nr:phosphotransferase [Myxococcaceae bacterium]